MDWISFGSISLIIGILALVVAFVGLWYARQTNRTTGFLKISVEFVVEDVWDDGDGGKEFTVEELTDLPVLLNPHLTSMRRQRHSLRFDIRNTGKQLEEILKLGFTLHNGERKEFPSKGKQRLPLTVESGHSKQLFWVLRWDEHEQFERNTEIWLETVRETVRVKVRK